MAIDLKPTFQHIIEKFQGKRVLCVGDCMLDKFTYGQINRISPEAPIPVFHTSHFTETLGGAANVALNLAKLGLKVDFVTVMGQDLTGQKIQSLLSETLNIRVHSIFEKDRMTTQKNRYIASRQQIIRIDEEQTNDITAESIRECQKIVLENIQQSDVIVLSDYHKGMLPVSLIQFIIKAARLHKKKILVDPKGSDYTRYHGCDVVTPNLYELTRVCQTSLKTNDQIVEAASLLIRKHDMQSIVVTRGQDGLTGIHGMDHNNFQISHIPARTTQVIDVSGAGDTMLSVLTACFTENIDFVQSITLANIAAGLVVAKQGTATLSNFELLDHLNKINPQIDDQTQSVSIKLTESLTWSKALQQVDIWRHQGLRVGFTNGCFDLLHPGHISILRQARQNCDHLIVAINSDASVQRLKGFARPICSEQARSQVLLALSDVDLVTVFDQDTPLNLIRFLRPDVLIKGRDYTLETVIGAQDVISWGGRVILADLEQGFSTTNLINQISAINQVEAFPH